MDQRAVPQNGTQCSHLSNELDFGVKRARIHAWVPSPAGSKKISFIFTLPEAIRGIRMSMVEDAVDDMYFGCNETMTEMIKEKYFKKENTGTFAEVWKNAKDCVNRAENNKEKGDEALTKDHLQAICVYTSGHGKFYDRFNAAVRTSKKSYGTSFPFHSLHFWLTSAVQILSNDRNCLTTYRRTASEFTGDDNQIIRFGFFASSSKRKNLTHFGRKTCFKIITCHGAYLKNYPNLKNAEEEVLIPPYEKFSIKKARNKFNTGLADCEVVYILQSEGFESNLNCKLGHKFL
ncbi:erythroblast NAD(P)(+)--arginine ADP-ribosyltransferase-like [Symphorus nematophorus]